MEYRSGICKFSSGNPYLLHLCPFTVERDISNFGVNDGNAGGIGTVKNHTTDDTHIDPGLRACQEISWQLY